MSTDSAGQAKKQGYKNVKVYLEGEPAWIKAGNPTYASKEFISKGNIVLLDLRSAEKSTAGRIPRSVTIPYATLKDKVESLPKKAPIVLYSDNTEESMSALKDLREAGLKKVSLVPGNMEGWIKTGGETTSGPVVTTIKWKRQLEKGEVSLADFQSAASGKATDAVILDVRTKDESAAGKYKNAISIPLDQVGSRKGELPKDKKIYIHCTTGARADMAAKELNKNGYNAFYLVGDVTCAGNDCTIAD
jgi:rhodanese-related sulfurtransferase